MHPLVKVLIGVLLLIVPLGLYAYEAFGGKLGLGLHLWQSLYAVLQGSIPPFVMLIGLFVIWLELDEWRIERELKAEEAKEKGEQEKEEKKRKKK